MLYYHPSSDSACKVTIRHGRSAYVISKIMRQRTYPQKNPLTIIDLIDVVLPIYNGSYPSYYRTKSTSPLFVVYHTDIPPALCMTRRDISGLIHWNTIMNFASASKTDLKSAHKKQKILQNKKSNPQVKNHIKPKQQSLLEIHENLKSVSR